MNKSVNSYAKEFNLLFMDEKTEFSKRLKNAMHSAGYQVRPVVLEREFNTRYWGHPVTLQAVRRWLRGEAIPAQDKLLVLAEWLQIEPQALRFGEATARSVKTRQQRWEQAMTGPEREVMEVFLTLPPEERKALRTLILSLAARQHPERLPEETTVTWV